MRKRPKQKHNVAMAAKRQKPSRAKTKMPTQREEFRRALSRVRARRRSIKKSMRYYHRVLGRER